MNPRPADATSDATALIDDFEWPPTADNVSVHEIDADPWHTNDADDADEMLDVIFEADAPAPAAPAAPAPRRTR
jgi:hypothetical protein